MSGQCSRYDDSSLSRTELTVLRKVTLKKISGNLQGRFPLGLEATGYEAHQPSLGKPYALYLENGNLIRTSVVRECRGEGFRTLNSLYSITVLEDKDGSRSSGSVLRSIGNES